MQEIASLGTANFLPKANKYIVPIFFSKGVYIETDLFMLHIPQNVIQSGGYTFFDLPEFS